MNRGQPHPSPTKDDVLDLYPFSRPYEDEKQELIGALLEWAKTDRSTELNLSAFESIVVIKNSFRTVTRENNASRRMINGARSGLLGDMMSQSHDPRYVKLSQLTDTIIMDGVLFIEFEHVGRDALGREFIFRSFKRRLDEFKDPQFHILLFSRPIALVGKGELERRRSLNELLVLYQQLDKVDQAICLGDTHGESTKHIAATVQMTTRSVELRRNKIIEHFGFRRSIDIVVLLVRLAEHGLIDPLE